MAQLYSSIVDNGYAIMYLTSRAIGQTDATKTYLQNIKQLAHGAGDAAPASRAEAGRTSPLPPPAAGAASAAGSAAAFAAAAGGDAAPASSASSASATSSAAAPLASPPPLPPLLPADGGGLSPAPPDAVAAAAAVFQLPPGPVITSPDRLFTAFTREVILRRPQEFKIAALSNIASLFPPDASPFCAGFGNRDTDVLAYRAVGIPESRIFVIDSAGVVQTNNRTFRKSYAFLHSHVDSIFPPVEASAALGAPGRGGDAEGRAGAPPRGTHPAAHEALFWRRHTPKLTAEDEALASAAATSGRTSPAAAAAAAQARR